ncbi:hypothetical protein PIB30_051416 [Stylosanthes scabra]|uniref:Uncharacterized protein n=1 Tax=Stylosanthes scabra TaxID=79078 RepID=A0ABU6XJ45_9FABA|nr:hypothetical protein [Stylosanthes scabra]
MMIMYLNAKSLWKKHTTLLGQQRNSWSDSMLCKAVPRVSPSSILARPLFRDRRKFSQMVDPLLEGHYPTRGLYQALAIAAMCVQEQPNMRPVIVDVVTALNYLASQKYNPQIPPPVQGCTRNPQARKDGDEGGNENVN